MSDTSVPAEKQPFWKTTSGKNALVVLAIIVLYPFVHSFLVQQSVKGPAPAFSANYVNGESFNLKDYQGEPLLIRFWATWCEICEHEKPDIETLANTYRVINIAIQSGTDREVLAFATKNSMNPDIIVNDKNKRLENLYNAHAVPASFVVDSLGNIQHVKHGYSGLKKLTTELSGL